MNPAISPDGKLVAYSRMTPAESRLVVQQLAGGEPVTVARWPGLYPAIPAWSPDGARLLYTDPARPRGSARARRRLAPHRAAERRPSAGLGVLGAQG